MLWCFAREKSHAVAAEHTTSNKWRCSRLLPHSGTTCKKTRHGSLLYLETKVTVTYESIDILAARLDVPSDALLRTIRIELAESGASYRTFSMKKRRGGERTIAVPHKRLRWIQSRILTTVLKEAVVDPHTMSYSPGSSTVQNARRHLNSAVVIRVDLANFFDSIGFNHVAATFSSLGWDNNCSETLAYLTTRAANAGRFLPQGASTSPALSNLAARSLDARLGLIPGLRYTRYCDDLAFSSESTIEQEMILDHLKVIASEVEFAGFRINPDKTRIMPISQRQVVTGIVVNGNTTRVSRSDLRRFRALLHQCEVRGIRTMTQEMGKNVLEYANGYLSYIHMVSPEQAQKIWHHHQWLRHPPTRGS